MTIDKKTIIIVCLVILCGIEAFFLFKKEPPVYDETLYKELTDSLKRQHDRDIMIANIHLANSIAHKKTADSLLNLSPQIHTQYVPVYQKISNAGAHALLVSADSIFANNNIPK